MTLALVTGATGFIGRRMVARLLDEGHRVRALVLPGESIEGAWPGGAIDVVRGDVTRPDSLTAALEGVDILIHLAAMVGDWGAEDLHRRVTVEGTENVLRAAPATCRVVLASSVVVYGDAIGRDVCDEDHPHGRPMGPYSRSKQAQETLARALAVERGMSLTVVRPTNVFGPGCKPWVHDVADVLRKGQPCLIGGGDQNAGLCHVDNLTSLLVRAATVPEAVGRVYNAADGSDVTWRTYFTDLAGLIGARPPRSIPRVAARLGASLGEGFGRLLRRRSRPALTHEALNLVGSHHRVPIDRARAELGYAPEVGYAEAIEQIRACLAEAGLAGA